jgi:hypothetical protein
MQFEHLLIFVLLLLSVASCSIKDPVLDIISKAPIDMSDDQVIIGWQCVTPVILTNVETILIGIALVESYARIVPFVGKSIPSSIRCVAVLCFVIYRGSFITNNHKLS